MLLLASRPTDVEEVQQACDLPGLAGFDHGLRIMEGRRTYARQDPKAPTG